MRIFHILIIIFVGIFLLSNDAESQLSIDTDIAIKSPIRRRQL